MDIVDYSEKTANETLSFLRKSYDELHERLQKVVTALIGGAGAVAAYALTKVGSPADTMQLFGLGALAVSWFVIAGVAAIEGVTSRELSPGNGPDNIMGYYRARLAEGSSKEDPESEALRATREAELILQQHRISEYSTGCTERARTLDWVYFSIAFSPLAGVIVSAIVFLRTT